jgi:hypothetical protein
MISKAYKIRTLSIFLMDELIKKIWYIYTYIYTYIYIHTHIYNGILFSNKEEQNHVVCRKMNGIRNHDVKQNKLDSELICFISYLKSRF